MPGSVQGPWRRDDQDIILDLKELVGLVGETDT